MEQLVKYLRMNVFLQRNSIGKNMNLNFCKNFYFSICRARPTAFNAEPASDLSSKLKAK